MAAASLAGVAATKKASSDAEVQCADDVPPPEPAREFRGVWVATVANIDWPSKPGLSTADQKTELIAILDRCVKLRLNAVIFQVRPACDALYNSKLEPWSEYLSGQQGRAPSPIYDPLELAVAEAHKRGLELHAWFNPYRARHSEGKSPMDPGHVSHQHPELVRPYGHSLWLDPGSDAVQDYTVRVVIDVVKRYDIDGVHIDDYFYPYKELDSHKQVIPFPDDLTWQDYLQNGGTLSRDDWRRDNVNNLVERLYREIKKEKSWVKFGISPFGIWRPGNPAQIKGYDAYEELYADSRKWIRNGWCDYLSPQLYWPVKQTAQSYPVLLKWWVDQNVHGRHIWPGNYTSRIGDASKNAWTKDELVQQILATRVQNGATGNVHFSMKPLANNRGGIADALSASVYQQQALPPASTWLKDRAPGKPRMDLDTNSQSGQTVLRWKPTGKEKPWLWVVQTQTANIWTTSILPADIQELLLPATTAGKETTVFAVSAVNRIGERSSVAIVEL